MATISSATLTRSGSAIRFSLAISWDSADLSARAIYDVLVEFMGDDSGSVFGGGDDLLFRFGFRIRPPTPSRTIIFTDERFDEDLGRDEVFANVSVIPRLLTGDRRRTNVVTGNF